MGGHRSSDKLVETALSQKEERVAGHDDPIRMLAPFAALASHFGPCNRSEKPVETSEPS